MMDRKFSLVSRLKNNDTKTIYGTRYSRDDSRMIDLCDNLVMNHDADINNIRFGGGEITLLGDTLTLSVDEDEDAAGFLNTRFSNRFQKLNDNIKRWKNTSNKYFTNVLLGL